MDIAISIFFIQVIAAIYMIRLKLTINSTYRNEMSKIITGLNGHIFLCEYYDGHYFDWCIELENQ